MTDHQLLRAAAIGMSNAATRARRAGDRNEAMALAGACLALHAAAGLTSDDVYLQEIAASAIEAWTRGESKQFDGQREKLIKVCSANWEEASKDAEHQHPHRG